MPMYEYKVVPAPKKGLKGKGIKGAEDRFANALMTTMNELGAEGWEYQRSDTLPCEERSGLRGRSTTFQNMLVFRREVLIEATPTENHVVESAATVAVTTTQSPDETRAPLLNGVVGEDHGKAPVLGPATDTTEVNEARIDLAAQ